eukprot:scaffold5790_cov101-Isochrysis_galbana.AAC.6
MPYLFRGGCAWRLLALQSVQTNPQPPTPPPVIVCAYPPPFPPPPQLLPATHPPIFRPPRSRPLRRPRPLPL